MVCENNDTAGDYIYKSELQNNISEFNDLFQVRYKQLLGLADLKYSSINVINMQTQFIKDVVELGFFDIRFDAAKHMIPSNIALHTVTFFEAIKTKFKESTPEYKNSVVIYEISSNVVLNDPSQFYWSTIEYFFI